MRRAEDEQRDRLDIGRILQVVLHRLEPAEELVDAYLTPDFKLTKNTSPLPLIREFGDLIIAPNARVAMGGGGVVIQCVHEGEAKIKYALKVTRPSLLSVLDEAADTQRREVAEFLRHAPLSHKNIARVYNAVRVVLRGAPMSVALHPMLMEWIDEPKPLIEYLATKAAHWTTVVDILTQCFEALAHLHDDGLVHWDLKSPNFLVDSKGVPRLSDFGSARRMMDEESRLVFPTRWNVPPRLLEPDALPLSSQPLSTRRTPIQLPEGEWDNPWVDLWMLSRELNRLFRADEKICTLDQTQLDDDDLNEYLGWSNDFMKRCFTAGDLDARFARRYLEVILRRLLQPRTPADVRFYGSASAVVGDLEKLIQPLGDAQLVTELETVPQHVMRVPIWNNVAFTPRLDALFNSRLVKRLKNHMQLGSTAAHYRCSMVTLRYVPG